MGLAFSVSNLYNDVVKFDKFMEEAKWPLN